MPEIPTSPMSIIASISDAGTEPGWKGRSGAEGPVTVPEPTTRPHEHAQWDEAHGRWIEWDDVAGEWVPVAEPATESGDRPGGET